MNKILIIPLFLVIPLIVSSQHNFIHGFIINNNNDSIYGEIDYKRKAKNSFICQFRKSRKDSISSYSPYQIKGYEVNNNRFISKIVQVDSFTTNNVFLEILIKGTINLYSFYSNGKSHYYIEREYFGFTEIPYKEIIKNVNGVDVLYNTTIHMEVLKQFMLDCPSLNKQISKINAPEEVPLIKLIHKYHKLTASDDNNIQFIKKTSHYNISVLPTYKYQQFENTISGNLSNYYLGALFIIGNNINERLCFKTGILFSQVTYTTTHTNILFSQATYTDVHKVVTYQIPWRINYIYPKYNLKPYIGIGLNTNYSGGPFFGNTDFATEIGMTYNLNRIFGLYSQFELDLSNKNGSIFYLNNNKTYKKYNFQFGFTIKLI